MDLAGLYIKRALIPWLVASALLVIMSSGLSGMYFGWLAASASFKDDQLALMQAQQQALDEKEARRIDAEKRSQQVTSQFLTALDALRASYPGLQRAITQEVHQDIYNACVLPRTGQELLRRQVAEANAQ